MNVYHDAYIINLTTCDRINIIWNCASFIFYYIFSLFNYNDKEYWFDIILETTYWKILQYHISQKYFSLGGKRTSISWLIIFIFLYKTYSTFAVGMDFYIRATKIGKFLLIYVHKYIIFQLPLKDEKPFQVSNPLSLMWFHSVESSLTWTKRWPQIVNLNFHLTKIRKIYSKT